MQGIRKIAFWNACLRALTTFSKFLLLFFLARFLDPAEVGIYGLIVATVSYTGLFLGLDFYTWTSREMLANQPADWPIMLRNQVAFHGVAYAVLLPLSSLIFVFDLIPVSLAIWFYVLLVLEHISQEAYRCLVTLANPIVANLGLFLRSGAWGLAAVTCMALWPQTRSLQTVWWFWCVGLIWGLVLSARVFRGHGFFDAPGLSIDWHWIRRGVRVAIPFVTATVALWGIFTIDRYIIRTHVGLDLLGIYVFFAGTTRVLHLFSEAGVGMILYPHIVSAFQQGEVQEWNRRMLQLTRGVLIITLLLSAALIIGIRPLLTLLNRPEYLEHLHVFWLLLASMVLLSLSLIPHFVLYATRSDRAIVLSSITGFILAVGFSLWWVRIWGITGVACANLAGVAWIGCYKLLACRRVLAQLPSRARPAQEQIFEGHGGATD